MSRVTECRFRIKHGRHPRFQNTNLIHDEGSEYVARECHSCFECSIAIKNEYQPNQCQRCVQGCCRDAVIERNRLAIGQHPRGHIVVMRLVEELIRVARVVSHLRICKRRELRSGPNTSWKFLLKSSIVPETVLGSKKSKNLWSRFFEADLRSKFPPRKSKQVKTERGACLRADALRWHNRLIKSRGSTLRAHRGPRQIAPASRPAHGDVADFRCQNTVENRFDRLSFGRGRELCGMHEPPVLF